MSTRGLLLAVALACACGPPAKPPDIVLVSVDTLRADHTSAYGYARDTSPFLTELAQSGALLEQAYAPTASTGPSHATLFTGTHVLHHGLIKNGLALPAENLCLAEVLAQRGYQTAAVVGSFVLDPKFGFDQGFDFYDADFQNAQSHPGTWQGHPVDNFDRRAEEATDTALRWLASRDPARPYFLFVHYFDPHAPYGAPGAFALRFAKETPPHGTAYVSNRYDAEIAYTDAQIRRLIEGLPADRRDDTLLMLVADHGEGLGDHGFPAHAALIYEEAVRVPWIARFPGTIPAGLRIGAPVGLVELAPTLLELAGVPVPPDMQGESLAAALRGERKLDPERPVYLVRRHYLSGTVGVVRVKGFKFGMRAGRWKYIEDEGFGTRELYDLATDPGELDDRYYAEPEVAASLRQRTQAWREATAGDLSIRAIAEQDRAALEALGYVE
jgi:arylsulfatase A-like enzyme